MLTICSECTSKNEWIWVKWPVWISLNRKQNSSKKSAGTTKLMPRSVSILPLSFCRLTHLCGYWLEVSFQSHAFAILIGRINFLHVSKTSIASLVAFSICTSAIIHLVCPPKQKGRKVWAASLGGSLEFQDSWGVIMNVCPCLVHPNAITTFSSGPSCSKAD